MTRITIGLLFALGSLSAPPEASALIRGGEGNTPLADPGWPARASAIFNHPGRVAWWEGPPFGGGQWHSECRGDAKALSAVLADFAKLDAKAKRVVVRDGAGQSFWLAPNNEPEKRAAARVDWTFTVWQPDSWERLRKLPADLNPTKPGDQSPPAEVEVYTASLDWAAVVVPGGIAVDDRRLSAHGFAAGDGTVLEGTVTDQATGQPIAATIRLERVEPRPKGGYLYPEVAQIKADDRGRWVLKQVQAGWVRVVAEADGYAPRVVAYARPDGQPCWQSYEAALSKAGVLSGRVVDEDGKSLADADIGLGNVGPKSGGRYESPADYQFKTDAEGRFRADRLPLGSATIWARKSGYCGPGLGVTVETPKDDVEVRMIRSAGVKVTVDFGGRARAGSYMVKMEPEGGDVVGSYGGGGNVDASNQMTFPDVPPGRYVLSGRPNPGSDSEAAEPVKVDLKGGQMAEVTLKAR